jgi:heme/copper-type cytochrome/quinol oxidase subunit 2
MHSINQRREIARATQNLPFKKNNTIIVIIIIVIIIIIIIISHYSPLLDIGLSNLSPSRSILGYSHPALASRPAQIITPSGLRES